MRPHPQITTKLSHSEVHSQASLPLNHFKMYFKKTINTIKHTVLALWNMPSFVHVGGLGLPLGFRVDPGYYIWQEVMINDKVGYTCMMLLQSIVSTIRFTTHSVSLYSTSPYVCTASCREVRVRFLRELETQMAAQYTVCKTILGRGDWLSLTCHENLAHLFWIVFWNFNDLYVPNRQEICLKHYLLDNFNYFFYFF